MNIYTNRDRMIDYLARILLVLFTRKINPRKYLGLGGTELYMDGNTLARGD